MARQYWPNGDVIGRQFRFASMKDEPPYSPMAAGGDGWLQIVGVVADARNDGLRNPIRPAFYVPYTLKMRMFTQILVRTQRAAAVDPARRARRAGSRRSRAAGDACAGSQRLDHQPAGIFAAAAGGAAVRDLLAAGARAVGGRALQRGLVRRGDQDQRVRDPHGARRQGPRRRPHRDAGNVVERRAPGCSPAWCSASSSTSSRRSG